MSTLFKSVPEGTYTNPENPGCYKTIDTICIPKTECKDYEIVADEGDDKKTDRLCGPCKCPEDMYGIGNVKWRNFRRELY